MHGRDVEGLKHDLCHLLTVGLWVERVLSKENMVLLWDYMEFIIESVMPDLKKKGYILFRCSTLYMVQYFLFLLNFGRPKGLFTLCSSYYVS